MLGARCPNCGGEVGVTVGEPELLRCPYCSYVGPPHPQVSSALHRARQVLFQRDARERQLTEAQRASLRSAATTERAFWWIVVAVLPLVAVLAVVRGVTALAGGVSEDNYVPLAQSVVVVVFALAVAGGTWIARRSIQRRRHALEDSCAAVPPPTPNDPARCHVCGAPLEDAHGAVVRCGYCHADNVVSSDVLKRAARVRALRLDDFETAIATESRIAQADISRATKLWVLAAGGSWFICGIPAACVAFGIAGMATTWNDVIVPNEEYALTRVPQGLCVARVTRGADGMVLDFGAPPPLEDPVEVTPLELRDLSVTDGFLRESGERVSIVHTGFRDYGGYAQISRGIYGGTETVRPFELCVVEEGQAPGNAGP